MLPVKEVNIVPTFKCNLNCDFCLYSELRKTQGKILLSIDILEKILNILKREESGLKRVAFFGGEILLLEKDYIYDIFSLTKKIFPDIAFGVVSNFIEIPSWFIDLVKRYNVYVNTSYEGIRFNSEDHIFKVWKENVDYISSLIPLGVNFVLTKKEDAYLDTLKVVGNLKFKYVNLVNFTIPDYFAFEKKKYLYEKYALTPEGYFEKFVKAVEYFYSKGKSVRGAVPITYTPVETLEIRPDGSVVITTASEEGFPFEKEIKIEYEEEETITYSQKRIEVAAEWLTNYPCYSCKLPFQFCLMEVRYPGVCPGIPDEKTIKLLKQAEEEKVHLCLK